MVERSAGLPAAYRRCFACRHDLTGSIEAGEHRCPECGQSFTEAGLLSYWSDPKAEAGELRPDEFRLSGRALIAGFLTLLLGTIVVLQVIAWLTGWAPFGL